MSKVLCVLLIGCCWFTHVEAADYRSVSAFSAFAFDAPSLQARKLWVLDRDYPVEVIVNSENWLKVKDVFGSTYWMEAKTLSSKRTAIVGERNAEVHQLARADSLLLATLDKDVVVELIGSTPKANWIKVRHRDGVEGYVLRQMLLGSE